MNRLNRMIEVAACWTACCIISYLCWVGLFYMLGLL